jgi:hypothetical protein
MGSFIGGIVQGIGSKRLAAALGFVFAAIVTFFLGQLLHVQVDPTRLAEIAGGLASPLIVYLFSQWHLDVATKGQTTTAFLTLNAIARQFETSTSPVVAEVAKALDIATAPEDGAAAAAAAPAAPVPAVTATVPPTAPPAS